MSVVDEIKTLSIKIENKDSFDSLIESLENYHEMVEAGLLKPRTNQIQSIYMPIEYKSNI